MTHEPMTKELRDRFLALARPLDARVIQWRQGGKPVESHKRKGEFNARFVAYIEAGIVRERLDDVFPGEWHLELEALPTVPDMEGPTGEVTPFGFKASITVGSGEYMNTREDVGVGKDYKQASTDAFKRAAVRFGIGHELYEMEQLWVPMTDGGKYAKPKEKPEDIYRRKHGGKAAASGTSARPVTIPKITEDQVNAILTLLDNEQFTEDERAKGHAWLDASPDAEDADRRIFALEKEWKKRGGRTATAAA